MRLMEFTNLINTGRFLTERDVVNAPAIKQWAIQAAQRVQDGTARAWFQSQVYDFLVNHTEDRSMVQPVRQLPSDAPEWLVKKVEMGSPIFQVTPHQDFATQAQSVSDWVNAWAAENPGSRVNYTWEQAVKASEEWHQDLARGASHGAEDAADPGLIQFMTFPDGYRWVMVQSPQCLSREGGRMGHCVGGYHQQVTSGETVILSLRSPQNTPHCTIEVNKPDGDFWTAVISTAAARAAELQRKADHPGQFDMNLGDAVGSLPQSQSLGDINQIKGKQNKPPVPKYIPYVKGLLDKHPFTMSYGGQTDLENIGYYYRNGKVIGLKDVAKVYRKYPNGTAWVTLANIKNQNTDDMYDDGSTGQLKLVDKNWTPVIGLKIHGTEQSIGNWITTSGDSKVYRDQMLDMMRTWKGQTDTSIATPLHQQFNIYMGHESLDDRQSDVFPSDLDGGFKFGTPDEVTTPVAVSGLESDVKIYRMVDHDKHRHYGAANAIDYVYEDGVEIGAVMSASTVRGKTIDYIQMLADTSVPLPKLLLGVSKAIGLPPKAPELLGLEPDGSIAPRETYGEEALESPGGEYTFLEDFTEENTLWVFEADHDVPLARIRHINANPVVDSALYSTNGWSDAGILGYFLLCLSEGGLLRRPLSSEYDAHDYGWTNTDGEWWYVAGADKVRVMETVTDPEGTKTAPSEITMDQLDGSLMDGDFTSQAYAYGNILSNQRYRHTDERYDDDDNEVGIEYYYELVQGQDIQYLQFDDYFYPFVKQMQATGKIR
jgi:hypothetical protein